MKTLLEYIDNNVKVWKNLAILDDEILTESFNCTVLQDINSYLQSVIKQDKKNKEAADKEHRYYYGKGKSFGEIFNYWNAGIQWDKITDDNCIKRDINNDKDKKVVQKICTNRKDSIDGMVILVTDDKDCGYKYPGIILHIYNDIVYYSLISNYSYSIGDKKRLKPSEINGFLTSTFYTIDLTDLLTSKIRSDRASAKSGVIPMGDEHYYIELAKKNLERYKAYAAKIKAERDANDGIPEKINEYTKKVMDIVTEFSKNPIKYASFEYDIQSLLDTIGDKSYYVGPHGRYDSGHRGHDGLLVLYSRYVKLKLSQAKGDSYTYEQQEYKQVKKNINETFILIDKAIDKINEKISKLAA